MCNLDNLDYRIAWRSNSTGVTGHGCYIFPSRKITQLNIDSIKGISDYKSMLNYWIERRV